MIVIDTNVIAYLFLGGERLETARAVFSRDARWAAPLLWRSEFRSVLTQAVRRDALSWDNAVRYASLAEELMRGAEYLPSTAEVLSLAARSDCSAYDCEFVAVAQRLAVPLVSFDRDILRDFPGLAIAAEEFA